RHKNPPRIESQNFIISVSTLRGSYQKSIYDRFLKTYVTASFYLWIKAKEVVYPQSDMLS
ncbi:hypothetical protein, partial [Ligilactobacillus murinus]|uniref:hypothetical protein n=1 Tax=Ligilactobacillus murinus TaxID=1622 RepID=UPI001CDD1ADD